MNEHVIILIYYNGGENLTDYFESVELARKHANAYAVGSWSIVDGIIVDWKD